MGTTPFVRDATTGDARSPRRAASTLPLNLLPDVRRADQLEACLSWLLEGRLVALCAAPGMGKSCLARQVVAEYERAGEAVESMSAAGLSGRQLVAALRNARRSGRRRDRMPSLVVVDDVPSLDDYDVDLVGRAIAGLRDKGVRFVLSLRPEAAQLLEAVDDPFVLTGAELTVGAEELPRWLGHMTDEDVSAVLSHTGGIAALVNEVRHNGTPLAEVGSLSLASLPGLVRSCVRDDLMDEERGIRLAMLLLGTGTAEEVEACVRRLDREVLRSLLDEAPLLGIDRSLQGFACIGALASGDLSCCEEAFRSASRGLQDVAAACAERLLVRGDAARAGFVLGSCLGEQGRDELALAWPGELINSGRPELVRAAARRAVATGRGDPDLVMVASSMVASLDGRTDEAAEALGRVADRRRVRRQLEQAEALLGSSRAWKGSFAEGDARDPHPASVGLPKAEATSPDKMTRSLRQHVAVRALMSAGQVEEAYRRLLVGPERMDEPLLTSELLREDAAIVGMLMGDDRATRDGLEGGRGMGFLMASGFGVLLAYEMAEREAVITLAEGGGDDEQVDRALRMASRRGDALVQATLMVLKGLGDICRGSIARAAILVDQAAGAARGLRIPYLSNIADAAGVLVALCAGEDASHAVPRGRAGDDAPYPEMAVMAEVARRRRGMAPRTLGLGGRCPAAALPLLLVAARSCGEVSGVVRKVIPEGWAADVDGFAQRWGGLREAARRPARTRRDDALLEVRMLGGLFVRCRGKEVSEDSWRRKAARTLLELLVIAPHHEVTRELASEALWPQSDLYTARNNIYAVMTSLRRAIGQRGEGPQFVVLDGGVIRADPDLVRCDVDEFRRLARSVLAGSGDDLRCMGECCELEGCFPGNIVMPSSDPTGLFSRCHHEIATLYADAMVAGSEAALRLGRATVAVRLARNAATTDPLREDVEEGVVRALIAAGRTREARLHYESYARKVIATLGVPPSARLRSLVNDACGREGDARSGKLEGMVYGGALPA